MEYDDPAFSIEYKGYQIERKQDFGTGHLIDGFKVKHGYIALKGSCNVMPGATWFLTVKETKEAIDMYELVEHDAAKFWVALSKLRKMKNETFVECLKQIEDEIKYAKQLKEQFAGAV